MSTLYCKSACSGKDCKYENYLRWTKRKNTHPGIHGLYSNWITDYILATARPSSRLIKEHGIINQFKESRIGAIINLQQPGEHAHCGDGNGDHGFSYGPEEFMNNDIFFYNFGWEDLDVPTLDLALNAVHVIDFTVKQQKRVAIHCHAGLGRTGLIIACYLVAYNGMDAMTAIEHVRQRRKGSVQNSKQVLIVKQFEEFLKDLRIYYYPTPLPVFTLETVMHRQRKLLHGDELETFRYVPQIVHITCNRLLELKQETHWVKDYYDSATFFTLTDNLKLTVEELKKDVNQGRWNRLKREDSPVVLLQLLQTWFQQLTEPIVKADMLGEIIEASQKSGFPFSTLEEKLSHVQTHTIAAIIKFFSQIDEDETQKGEANSLFDTAVAWLSGVFPPPDTEPSLGESFGKASSYFKSIAHIWRPVATPRLIKQRAALTRRTSEPGLGGSPIGSPLSRSGSSISLRNGASSPLRPLSRSSSVESTKGMLAEQIGEESVQNGEQAVQNLMQKFQDVATE